MVNIIKGEFKQSLNTMISLALAAIFIFVALAINSTDEQTYYLTDKFDYIIPFIVIIYILKNFRYLKDKDDCYSFTAVPLTKNKIFLVRYSLSIIQILSTIVMLCIAAYGVSTLAKLGFIISSHTSIRTSLMAYFISCFVKIIFTGLLFNLFLFVFLCGKKVVDGIINMILFTLGTSLIYCAFYFLVSKYTYYSIMSLITPLNIFNTITEVCVFFTYDFPINGLYVSNTIYTVMFIVCSIISIVCIHKKINKLNIEKMSRVNNAVIYRVIIIPLAFIVIVINSLLIKNYEMLMALSILSSLCFYIMYSLIIDRFRPTNPEMKVYFLFLAIILIIPYLM